MGRNAKDRRPVGPRPVDRISLSEKHFGRRLAAFAICLAVGIAGIAYGVNGLLNTGTGWTAIEETGGQTSCANEFVLEYLVKESGFQASADLRRVRVLYTEMARTAYQLFSTTEQLEDVHNLCYINAHPNENIVVDPLLYQAFQLVEEYGDRGVYLGPVYSLYEDLFYCEDDSQTLDFDPFVNPETAAYYQELAAFSCNPAAVNVKLLGENTLCLEVSETYMSYAEDVGRASYLDFGWQKNGFIIDYFANKLEAEGLDQYMIASKDGYTRCGAGEGFLFSLYDWLHGRAVLAGETSFAQKINMVNFRVFPLNSVDAQRFYVFSDGDTRHQYIDLKDGLCKSSASAITVYSQSKNCAALMLAGGKVFIQEKDRLGKALAALPQGVEAMAIDEGKHILCTDPEQPFSQLYESGQVKYQHKVITAQ